MIKTLLCLGFLGTALSFPFDGRVVNGTTAKEGEYPYVVSFIAFLNILIYNNVYILRYPLDQLVDPIPVELL